MLQSAPNHVCRPAPLHLPIAGLLGNTTRLATILLASTGVTGPLPELNVTNNNLVTLDLSNARTLANATIPGSWPVHLPALGCLALRNTSMCGPVPAGLPCFLTVATSLGALLPAQPWEDACLTQASRPCGATASYLMTSIAVGLAPFSQPGKARSCIACETLHPAPDAHATPTGKDCANPAVSTYASSAAIPECRVTAPQSCAAGDPLMLPPADWSGGSSDFRALQSIRAAITNGSVNASDPWSHRAPCFPLSPGALSVSGLTCGSNRTIGLRAAAVFGCEGPGCTWGGWPWRPVPDFATLTALQTLDLANMDMAGARTRHMRLV